MNKIAYKILNFFNYLQNKTFYYLYEQILNTEIGFLNDIVL